MKRLKLTPLSCEERAAMVLSIDPDLTREQIDPKKQYSSLAKALADNDLLKQSGLPQKIKELVKNNFSRVSPYTLQTPSEVSSRKPSMDMDAAPAMQVDVDDIHYNMFMPGLTRENSVTGPGEEEVKADLIQSRLESKLYNSERRRCRAKD